LSLSKRSNTADTMKACEAKYTYKIHQNIAHPFLSLGGLHRTADTEVNRDEGPMYWLPFGIRAKEKPKRIAALRRMSAPADAFSISSSILR
jgi:hypothetical protein